MLNKFENISADYVRRHLNYDELTGIFTWNLPGRGRQLGKPLGSPQGNGYLSIRVQGVLCLAHRLAWLYVNGTWPEKHIDHINGNRADNSIANLRDVSQTENNQNIQKAQQNSASGYLGVREHKGRFHANIGVNSKSVYLGTFETAELASEAYQKAKLELHKGAIRGL